MDATTKISRFQEVFDRALDEVKKGYRGGVRVLELLEFKDSNTLTALTELTNLSTLTTKTQILLILIEQPLSLMEIVDKLLLLLNKPEDERDRLMKSVFSNLQYKERKTGLLYEGVVTYSEETRKYAISEAGRGQVVRVLKNELLEQIEQKTLTLSRIEAAERQQKTNDFCQGILKKKPLDKSSLWLDFFELAEQDPELADQLLDNPEETIKAMTLALESNITLSKDIKAITVRITNLPKTDFIKVGEIRAEHIGKFRAIRGTITEVTEVKPMTTSCRYECPACGNVITVLQLDRKLKEPSQCGCGRKGKFKLLCKELVDMQKIIIEELPEELGKRSDPQTKQVILTGDLTNIERQHHYESTDPVIVNGIIKELAIPAKDGGMLTTGELIVEANSIQFQEEESEILTQDDIALIEKYKADNKDYIEKVVESFAPHIYGLTKEKLAMLVCIVSGSNRKEKFRDDSHLLLAGDPSTGKSQLLNEGNEVTYRSRKGTGEGSSGKGLAAAVDIDPHLMRKTIRKGLFPLANHSVVFCDELDKMNKDERNRLHEPLENQTVTIDKAGMHRRFVADCSLIAACNPRYGKFQQGTAIVDQIELPDTLRSRFDLIICMKNINSEELDRRKIDSIVDKFSGETKAQFDREFIAKYLYYSKYFFRPELTDKCKQKIKKFYIDVRKESNGTFCILERQGEGLIRLTLACAKLALRKKTTEDDVDRAIMLMKHSFATMEIMNGNQVEVQDFNRQKTVQAVDEAIKAATLTTHDKGFTFDYLKSFTTIEDDILKDELTRRTDSGKLLYFGDGKYVCNGV